MIKLLLALTSTVLFYSCKSTHEDAAPAVLSGTAYNQRALFIHIDSATLDSFYRTQVVKVRSEQQMQFLESAFQVMKFYSQKR
jgi:hypothetical protein